MLLYDTFIQYLHILIFKQRLLFTVAFAGQLLLTKEEANVLSHAMVEKKDIEGGCSGLWMSHCRAEFYGTSQVQYIRNLNCTDIRTVVSDFSHLQVLLTRCVGNADASGWFVSAVNSLPLNTTALLIFAVLEYKSSAECPKIMLALPMTLDV